MAQARNAGYRFLTDRYKLKHIAHWRSSFVTDAKTGRHSIIDDDVWDEFYPARNWPGERACDHLEFAIKYDGINLALLCSLFRHIEPQELADFILEHPVSIPRRKLWFLYEFLTGTLLPLEDADKGNYILLLDPEEYYTLKNGVRSSRQRVINNLTGTVAFCPLIRRTNRLKQVEQTNFIEQCAHILDAYPPELLRRALSYLYTKETKSSFAIEHIKPTPSRREKFVSLLTLAETDDFCERSRLLELQNMIVDSRFADTEFRTIQNYVGQTITFQKEIVHYIAPKPEDVESLIEGLVEAHQKMHADDIPAIVHAATIAYGFVFIHPFSDGNGRIHRFLIHNILARRGFTPKGLMIPVSAAMLNNPAAYDQSLETFSRPLLQQIEYTFDAMGKIQVQNETAHWYRYIDMTAQAEALLGFISETISRELIEELDFLVMYNKAKGAIQEIVDLPDRQIDFFINFCISNNGKLSARKRESHFEKLTEQEITGMEEAVKKSFSL